MQHALDVRSLGRTRILIDWPRLPAATWPCSGIRFATSAHRAPTKASCRLIAPFRGEISGGDGSFPDRASSFDEGPASDPLQHRTGFPALDYARISQSHPPFSPCP